MLFIVDDLPGPVDSRDPQGSLWSALVSCGQPCLRQCRAAGSGQTQSVVVSGEVAALFISLVDEISRNDARPEIDGGTSRLTNNAR